MYDGVFPCCTNAAELLKRQVGVLPLRDAQDKEVEQTSADFGGVVNALFKTYSSQSKNRTDTVLGWSKQWHKDRLVEQRPQDEINKHQILITKCLGAEKEFRIFYQVR